MKQIMHVNLRLFLSCWELPIWRKTMDGVYSADPRIDVNAKNIMN